METTELIWRVPTRGETRMQVLRLAVLIVALAPLGACAAAPRIVAEDPSTGFAIYRSGRLDVAALRQLCRAGVEEILVLDGTGRERECQLRETVCPGLTVRYDRSQDPDQPLTESFLGAFDAWVEESRDRGRRIAFRCRHGWHRAGRLAAYYRLRFQGVSAAAAQREMHRVGRLMWLHPSLDAQVDAYADLVAGRPCSTDLESCPSKDDDPALVRDRFAPDLCAANTLGGAND